MNEAGCFQHPASQHNPAVRSRAMSNVVYKSLDFLGLANYRVGTDGSVWSSSRKRPWFKLADRPDSKGRLYVSLGWIDGKSQPWAVAHLVLLAFVGPRPCGLESCHKDGNHLNNTPGNLRWDTHQSNMKDRSRHGRSSRHGSSNGFSILSDVEAQWIRDVGCARVWKSKRQAAKGIKKTHPKIPVSEAALVSVIAGKSWKHLG